jgi:hypothetical protein
MLCAKTPHRYESRNDQPKNRLNSSASHVQREFASLPMAFEPNQGQTDPAVKYMARGRGYKLYLTPSEAILTVRKRGQASEVMSMIQDKRLGPAKVKNMLRRRQEMKAASLTAVVRMQMLGGNSQAGLSAADPESGKVNYFIGNDPTKWHSNIPLYGRVSYKNLYPGVDLAFHGAEQQLEFDYLVSPGANPGAIALGFRGARKMSTTAAGDLVLDTAAGPLEMHRPVAYQEKGGARENVKARFQVRNSNEVAFSLGPYDHNRELVIDPTITYSTYFGGNSADHGLSIVADSNGDTFMAGETESDYSTLPGTPTGPIGGVGGGFDVFVTEIKPTGELAFISIFGGSLEDSPGFPSALAIDSSGIYVAGTTASTDFPVTTGVAQSTFGSKNATNHGANDAFAAKLSSDGSSLTWATYIGGNDSTTGLGIAVDSNKNVYVVGETFSSNLPVVNPLPGGGSLNLGKGTGDDDGYIAALNSTATSFSLVSYIGGSGIDTAAAVALDGSGNAYVTGSTISSDLPVTSGVVQSTLASSGIDDIFVCSIAAKSFTATNAISSPNIVARPTRSYRKSATARGVLALWLPVPAFALFGSIWCSADSRRRKLLGISLLCLALVTLMVMPACGGGNGSSGGGGGGGGGAGGGSPSTAYNYLTYYGGTGPDEGIAIAVDTNGNAFVTGQTQSTDFPLSSPAYQSSLAGAQNSFLLELNPAGSKALYATYFGGNGSDAGLGIAIDSNDNAYLTGQTSSTAFPVAGTDAATQPALSGPTDAYVSVLSPGTNTLVFSTYLGGSGDEDQLGGSIYVNTTGIYVTGDTDSSQTQTTTGFPIVGNAVGTTWGGGTCTNSGGSVPCTDGFITVYSLP